jgi:hypothetical protein
MFRLNINKEEMIGTVVTVALSIFLVLLTAITIAHYILYIAN